MGMPSGEGKPGLPDRLSTQQENNPPLDAVSEFRFPPPAPHDDKYSNDHDSRRSSASMSSNLELNHIDHSERRQRDEENGFSDGSSKSHSRLGGTLQGDKDDEDYDEDLQSWVNQQFVTKVVVNGILIGLWYVRARRLSDIQGTSDMSRRYLFSVSISVVSLIYHHVLLYGHLLTFFYSTTSGCSRMDS